MFLLHLYQEGCFLWGQNCRWVGVSLPKVQLHFSWPHLRYWKVSCSSKFVPLKRVFLSPGCFENVCLLIVAVYMWGALHISSLGAVSLPESTLCCHYQFWKIRSYYLFIYWPSPVLPILFRGTQILYTITFPRGFTELFPTLFLFQLFKKWHFVHHYGYF